MRISDWSSDVCSSDLLRHAAVVAAQASLEVGQGNAQLGRHQGAGQRRIHVADDDGPVRALLLADLFVGDHDGGGLLGMRAAADAEMMVRRRQAEVGKEAVRPVDRKRTRLNSSN